MKKQLAFLGFILVFFTSVCWGQSEKTNYLKMDYIRIAPDKTEAFLDFIESTWKPIHQDRVNSGEIHSWTLYKVRFPGGTKSDYNFVSITAANNLEKMEDEFPADIVREKEKKKHLLKQLDNVRTVVFSELWKVVNKVKPDKPSPEPARFLMMDYMKVTPGKNYDYRMLEDEIAKPIHEERINLNKMQGWEVYSLISPGGTEYGYNFATGNFFTDLENIEFGFTEEVINHAMPGTNIPELFDTIFATRERVRSEVWEMIERTTPSSTKSK